MDWGLAKVLKEGGVADEPPAQPASRGERDRDGAERLGPWTSRRPAASWARPRTWPPSRPPARSTGSTAGPTSSAWARSSARSSPAGRPTPGRSRPRSSARRCGATRPSPGPAGRLRGRGRAGRPGEGLPGGRAGGPAARRGRRRRADHGLSGGRAGAGAGGRAGACRGRGAGDRGAAAAKVQLALAASVLALTTLGGLSTTYYLQQRQARAAAGQRVIDQVTTLRRPGRSRTRGHPALGGRAGRRRASRPRRRSGHQGPTAGPAERRSRPGSTPPGATGRCSIAWSTSASAEADDPDGSVTDAAYADAFREAGIDLASLPPAEAGAKIRARPPSVALALAAALDDWAAIRRGKRRRRRRGGAAERSRPHRRPRPLADRAADQPWINPTRRLG